MSGTLRVALNAPLALAMGGGLDGETVGWVISFANLAKLVATYAGCPILNFRMQFLVDRIVTGAFSGGY